jgi:hypothetical protein
LALLVAIAAWGLLTMAVINANGRLAFRWAPIPDTPQELFFDDDTADGNLLLQGGWGAGKTMTLLAKMLRLSAINRPLPGLWTVPEYGHVDETILPTLIDLDPTTGEPWFLTADQFHYHQTKHVLSWIGGGPIQFVSAEAPERIRGPNMAFAGTDEPHSISHEAWRNTCARVRHVRARLRQKVAAGTPEGITYLQDYFGADREAKYRLYVMETQQNVELMRANPEFVRQIRAHLTEAEALVYLGGRAVNVTGALAYPMFDAEVHWRPDVLILPALPLRLTFDFNVDPMTCVIGQQSPGPFGPEARVIDGITIYGGSTVMETCDEIVRRYPKWPPGIVIYGDETGKNRTTTSIKSNYEIIRERLATIGPLTTKVPTRNPPVATRLNAVNTSFLNALGQMRLFIRKTLPARDCMTRPLVRSLQMTKIKSGTEALEKKQGETHTHPADALGYWIAVEFPGGRLRTSGSDGPVNLSWL